VNGTLEALLSTPTSIYTVLIGNSHVELSYRSGQRSGLIAAGFLIIHSSVARGAAAALVVLLLTFFAFLMVGMLSASFVIISNAATDTLTSSAGQAPARGILFPSRCCRPPAVSVPVYSHHLRDQRRS